MPCHYIALAIFELRFLSSELLFGFIDFVDLLSQLAISSVDQSKIFCQLLNFALVVFDCINLLKLLVL